MNDSEFAACADAALTSIEAGLEASGADLDFSMVSEGVLEIEFSDGAKIIVNRHAAAQEIWVAARSGGRHFRWNGENWLDTRDSGELMAVLSALLSDQTGVAIDLT